MSTITKNIISFQIVIIILAFSFTIYKTVVVGDFQIVNYVEEGEVSEDNTEFE